MATRVNMKSPDLWVGGEESCTWKVASTDVVAVVHACKYPCHAYALGYAFKGGKVDRESPEYLMAWRGDRQHLVLNIVDAPNPAFFRVEMFRTETAHLLSAHGPVLVHCNKGESRAPAIALVCLAQAGVIPAASYEAAKADFLTRYPAYAPGVGIEAFLRAQWKELVA